MNVSYQTFERSESFKISVQQVIGEHSGVFVLVDSNTAEHCLPELLRTCDGLSGADILEVEPGETSKCFEVAVHLIEHLIEQKADKHSLLICLGGGVVTDLGSFVASIYKRGINVLHLPTSLLAMIDASIGGKTGIDHLEIKNVVGTFHPPLAIFSYLNFLDTLPHIELESAAFEMLKHGLIADLNHATNLMALDKWSTHSLKPFIQRSAEIKMQIVEKDPKEKGVRVHLNFGHTAGHALESALLNAGGAIPHGVAVGLGMMAELGLHQKFQWLLADELEPILVFLRKKLKSYLRLTFDKGTVAQFLLHDKKNKNGDIHMVRLVSLGSAKFTVPVSVDDMLAAMEASGIVLTE